MKTKTVYWEFIKGYWTPFDEDGNELEPTGNLEDESSKPYTLSIDAK